MPIRPDTSSYYNLVDNALKFTNEDGYISFNIFTDSDGYVIFKIRNSAGEFHSGATFIFERFYKPISPVLQ